MMIELVLISLSAAIAMVIIAAILLVGFELDWK